MVTVAYERDRGLREKYLKPDGYEISHSKTMGVPVDILFQYFSDTRKRKKWLGNEKIHIRKSTKNKSMRIT